MRMKTYDSTVRMEQWKNKVAVVTGASSGIGRAVAARLAEEGMRVVAVARREARLQELASRCKGLIYPFACDITKEEDLIKLFKKVEETIGPCHVLVNSAGAASCTSVLECNLEQWRYMFELNVLALGSSTREAIASMKMNAIDHGYIINISSIASHGMPQVTERFVYNATKHAVRVITEGARMELAQINSGIKISTISPGVVDTEIFEVGGWGNFYLNGSSPVLQPEDISDAAVTLLSSAPTTHIAEIIVRGLGETVMA